MSAPGPIKVAFLTFYYEAWDALAEIHRLMLADPRFEVAVVAIDRKLTGDAGFGGADEVSAFFAGAGVAHVVNADLATVFDGAAPDYIFVNYPWQRNYPKQYRPDALARIGRICYVPYFSLNMTREPDQAFDVAPYMYTQRMHQLASLIFVQDDEVREAFEGTARGAAHVHFVGSTKLDALIAAMRHSESASDSGVSDGGARSKRRTLLWAPHHSYSPHWLNFGNFASSCEKMLDWAKANQNTLVILRPHPFMFGTLVDRGVMPEADLQDWLRRWRALPNTSVDSESTTAELFSKADNLLTDGISYLVEWPMAKGDACIFLENPGHWKFTAIGEQAALSSIRIESIDELDLAFMLLGMKAPVVSKLRAAALPFPGETASRIVEIVASDISELVDPESVTDVPWELQPGREPLD
jgi:hypothetical protein